MAINVPAASASTTAALADAKASNIVHTRHQQLRTNPSKVSFSLSKKPEVRFLSKGSSRLSHHAIVKAQLNKVSATASPTATTSAIPDSNSVLPTKGTKDEKPEDNSSTLVSASEEIICEFISQVADLVKLVDSKDIVELQMKQLDCELLIRKKEAIAPIVPPAPMMMMQAHHAPTPAPQVASPAPATPQAALPAPAPSAPKPVKSSIPPLKSPMAGTLYRSPAPGAPPFVKVGDKVQKGQVICIVEAMKLMNEIEADHSGTVVEFLAEDAKPVSFDTPILVIQP